MVQRKNLMLLVAGLVLALMAILVIASHGATNIISAPALQSPSTRQNISNVTGYLLLNATVDIQYNTTKIVNVTFRFQNRTGYFVLNTTVQNTSQNQTIFQNLTFLSTILADGKYNITVTATNGSVLTNNSFSINSSAAINVTIDNTPPNVTRNTANNPGNASNFSIRSNNQTFNVSVFDAATDTNNVYFWFDNGTGQDFNVTPTNLSGEWFVSYNVSALVEARQGIRVMANDTVGNVNNSLIFNITVDFTSPNVTLNFLNANNVGNASMKFNFSIRSSNQTFNATVLDNLTGVANVYFWFDNGTGNDFNVSAFNLSGVWFISYNVSTLSDGRQGVYVVANDSAGNINSSFSLNFTVDLNTPNLTVNSLNDRNMYNGTNFSLSSNNYTFNVSAFDSLTEVSNASYFWFDNGTGQDFNVTAVNNSGTWTVSYNLSALVAEKQGVRLVFNDTVGNTNNTEINFTVDKTVPGVSASTSAVTSTAATLTVTINDTGANNCSYGGSETGGGSVLSGTGLTGNGAMTSFTATLTLVPSTAYSITVNCTDFAGNYNTATTSVTSAATASSSNGGGGSGGSGGGVSANVQGQVAKEIWTSINAGETATVEVENGAIGVTEVSFSVPATVYGAWLQVAKKDSLPSSVADFGGKVYRNLEITKGPALNKEGAFTDATVKFKVEKAWLSENQVTMEAVALYHYADGEWKQLQTQVGEDDGTYVHYSAKTPGFSYFVIGQQAGAESSLGSEVPAAEQPAAPVEAPVEEAAQAAAKKKTWIAGLLAALVVVVAVVVYLKRRK